MEEDDGHPENGVHAAKDSDRQQRLRLCVLNEIVNTERDYVRTLLFLQSVSFDVTSVCVSALRPRSALPFTQSGRGAGTERHAKVRSEILQFRVAAPFCAHARTWDWTTCDR